MIFDLARGRTVAHKLQLGLVALATVLRVRIALSLNRADIWRARNAALCAQVPSGAPQNCDHHLREIAWSVGAAARLVPVASCLTQALAGQYLLAQRGVASDLRLSLPAGQGDAFRPHAWLLHEGQIVLGGSAEMLRTHQFFVPPDRSRPAEGRTLRAVSK
ncbi:hypothetical protein DL1_07340 [Thioclava dalianensis]|uniref:Microcin J25-processing protein McjB C-terminal domain-containing protein n=1 Tax=Thioclava dalianensis TaxID=1185766 RepID=A0A074TIC3_9RHOB|nr:lasso peptide biosynthesis B2 protein [Thioclava dalianensis]KEP71394.1 hypothetical protein DL1_07340 [Thioclava dalianensis]SFM79009.1 Transglutaminase-like superfamily protein [Thioclava dalianensis]